MFFLAIIMQIFHIAFALLKHRSYPSYHTNFSRLTAYFLFFGVLTFWFLKESIIISILTVAWTATVVEGIIITCVLEQCAGDLADVRAAILANTQRQETLTVQQRQLVRLRLPVASLTGYKRTSTGLAFTTVKR
jgi:hypothetical protein